MNRRQALKLTTITVGGSIVGAEFFLAGCKNDTAKELTFSEDVLLLLDEIGETILPETDRSPGAKAAKIGFFIKDMVTDCYSEEEQQTFMKGLYQVNIESNTLYSKGFMEIDPEDRLRLLLQLDEEANNNREERIPHYFTMMKQLTVLGYFTSEPGATQALRYNPTPGRFDSCIPYQVGDKAWA